jgi:hypothetical protein
MDTFRSTLTFNQPTLLSLFFPHPFLSFSLLSYLSIFLYINQIGVGNHNLYLEMSLRRSTRGRPEPSTLAEEDGGGEVTGYESKLSLPFHFSRICRSKLKILAASGSGSNSIQTNARGGVNQGELH